MVASSRDSRGSVDVSRSVVRGFSSRYVLPVGGPPVPRIVQHVTSSANPAGVGITGKTFKIPFPDPNGSGAGNCLILACAYPHGSPPTTISDPVNGAWSTTPAFSVDAGVGGYVAAFFVFPNTAAGVKLLTVAFGSAIIPFQYDIWECNNIALTSPVNGSHGTANVSAPNLACGAFTPTNNDANGGNLILAYFPLSSGAGGNPTNWAVGSGFTGDSADIAWNTGQGFPHAAEHQLQTTAGAINPGMTATGDTSQYNCIAIALKVASAGTGVPAGIHVNAIQHTTSNIPPNGGPWKLQAFFTGNCRAMTTNNNDNGGANAITAVADSDGNNWIKFQGAGYPFQIWRAENTSPSPTNGTTLTLTITGQLGATSNQIWDIQGAAASPLGATASASLVSVNGVSTISNHPSITPQAANSLVIAAAGLGQGPGLSITAPPGANFDFVTYPPEEIDTDLMENADLLGHVIASSTATQNWAWTFTNQASNSTGAVAVEFKAA